MPVGVVIGDVVVTLLLDRTLRSVALWLMLGNMDLSCRRSAEWEVDEAAAFVMHLLSG